MGTGIDMLFVTRRQEIEEAFRVSAEESRERLLASPKHPPVDINCKAHTGNVGSLIDFFLQYDERLSNIGGGSGSSEFELSEYDFYLSLPYEDRLYDAEVCYNGDCIEANTIGDVVRAISLVTGNDYIV